MILALAKAGQSVCHCNWTPSYREKFTGVRALSILTYRSTGYAELNAARAARLALLASITNWSLPSQPRWQVAALPSTGAAVSGPNQNQCTVNLTGLTNAQYITVALNGVVNATGATGNVSVTMGLLMGDTTANGFVNSSDISQTQSQSGQPVTSSNFREDVTANGAINSSDISLVQSLSGTALPAAPASQTQPASTKSNKHERPGSRASQ